MERVCSMQYAHGILKKFYGWFWGLEGGKKHPSQHNSVGYVSPIGNCTEQCSTSQVIVMGKAPAFMNNIFAKNENTFTENVSSNRRSKSIFYNPSNPKTVKNGLETLRCIGPKIWDIVPSDIKNSISLSVFKAKIKKWIPHNCPCRLCKVFVPQLGFLWFSFSYDLFFFYLVNTF